MGSHFTADYGSEEDVSYKQLIISQQLHRPKMLSLWIKNSLTTDAKCKLRAFKDSYTYYNQDYGSAMIFVIVKMVRPETHAGYSDIKTKL